MTKISKAIASAAIFVIATILLYLAKDNGIINDIIFFIGFGLVILMLVFVWIKPTEDEWEAFSVIPMKRKK